MHTRDGFVNRVDEERYIHERLSVRPEAMRTMVHDEAGDSMPTTGPNRLSDVGAIRLRISCVQLRWHRHPSRPDGSVLNARDVADNNPCNRATPLYAYVESRHQYSIVTHNNFNPKSA